MRLAAADAHVVVDGKLLFFFSFLMKPGFCLTPPGKIKIKLYLNVLACFARVTSREPALLPGTSPFLVGGGEDQIQKPNPKNQDKKIIGSVRTELGQG